MSFLFKPKLSTLAIATAMALSFPLLNGCGNTVSNSQTTDRSQLMLVSSEEIVAESATEYDKVIAQARAQGKLNTDPALTKRVQSIGNKLIAQVPRYRPDAANWDWEINVINEDILNAWCMAGGKIAVYSGIVNDLNLTDDEIATIMGHEISHALREHIREQMSAEMAKQGAFAVASLFGVDNTTLQLSDVVAQVGFSLPFSRTHETEADELGLELMYAAGYNPDAAATLWTKMTKMSGGNDGLAALLSTHPSDSSRIENLSKLSAELKTNPNAGRVDK